MHIIGIAITTSNKESAETLSALWKKFYTENVPASIPNALNKDVYAIYTDYESDHTGRYTAIIGLQVDSIAHVPTGLIGRSFEPQEFKKIIAKGQIPQAVVETWQTIWAADDKLNRSYIYDFEHYSSKSFDGVSPEVDIYIGINPTN